LDKLKRVLKMAVPFHEAKALLKSMFPAMDEATIGEMLRDNGGHMERTCEQLLAFFDTDANRDSDGGRDRAHQGAKRELFSLNFRSTFAHFLVHSVFSSPGGAQGGGMAQGDGKEGGSSPHIRFGPPQIQVLCNLI
jgi:hypothetical protein